MAHLQILQLLDGEEKKMLWVLHEAIHDLELKALKQSHVTALTEPGSSRKQEGP